MEMAKLHRKNRKEWCAGREVVDCAGELRGNNKVFSLFIELWYNVSEGCV
jgi:hypothetical protein